MYTLLLLAAYMYSAGGTPAMPVTLHVGPSVPTNPYLFGYSAISRGALG